MNAQSTKKRADLRSPEFELIINDAPASRKDRHQEYGQLSLFEAAAPMAAASAAAKITALPRNLRHISEGQLVLFDIGVAGTSILVIPTIQETPADYTETPVIPEATMSIEEIIEKHRRLVKGCMKSVGGISPMDRDDIEQAGLIALWRAAEKFDPTRGIRFESYAAVAIKRAMFRATSKAKNKLNPASWEGLEETCPTFESMLATSADENPAQTGSHPVLRRIFEQAGSLRTAKERKGVQAYALFMQGYSAPQISKVVGFSALSTTAMVSVGRKVVQANPIFQRIASELMSEPRKQSIMVELLGTPFELRYANNLSYDLPVKFNDNFLESFAKLISSKYVAEYILDNVRIGDEICIVHKYTGCSTVMTVKESVLEVYFVAQISKSQLITA